MTFSLIKILHVGHKHFYRPLVYDYISKQSHIAEPGIAMEKES